MARGPKRPTVLEHGRPPRPDAWEGPAGYLVSRPELRDRIAKFIEDAADGAVCLVIGDWGTGKTVVACEVGHYLLTHRPRRAIYHAYIDRVGDPDRAHEAVDALSKWLRRWPVPRFYHRRPLLVLEDLHRDLRAATDVVPRLVDDAGALILSTTRSERKDAGEEVRGSAGGGGEDGDVLLLASGREVPLPLQLCRLAKDSGRCLPIELTLGACTRKWRRRWLPSFSAPRSCCPMWIGSARSGSDSPSAVCFSWQQWPGRLPMTRSNFRPIRFSPPRSGTSTLFSWAWTLYRRTMPGLGWLLRVRLSTA